MLDATPILKLYATRRLRQLQRMDPVAAQRRELLNLVRHAELTQFGLGHNFAKIHSVAEYQARVPLRRYEDFWRDWWQPRFPRLRRVTWPDPIRYFAASSGTSSGNTKFIPVSPQMVNSNRLAVLDLLTHHYENHPRTRIMGGQNFMLGGNPKLAERAPGIHSGDLSGIAANELPWWAKARYFPSYDLACIADWDEKITRLAPLSLEADIRMLGGTVSWLLAFIERALALKPGAEGLKDIYPGLEMLVHGGVNFAPYRRRFEELLAGSRAETREVYPASEGFVAVADRGSEDGMRLMLDNGLFFEFVPVEELDSDNPTRHWIRTAEAGQNYAIVLTTNAGLWSYILGDTVRFVDRAIPRIVVTGRISYYLSAFGEHVIGEEIETSVAAAAVSIQNDVADYSVGALYPEHPGDKGRHLYIVEFSQPVDADTLARFATVLDKTLCDKNLDYREHRAGNFQMSPPLVQPVRSGTFAAWMKARGKLGAQNKVPRVINDEDLLRNLRQFADANPQIS